MTIEEARRRDDANEVTTIAMHSALMPWLITQLNVRDLDLMGPVPTEGEGGEGFWIVSPRRMPS